MFTDLTTVINLIFPFDLTQKYFTSLLLNYCYEKESDIIFFLSLLNLMLYKRIVSLSVIIYLVLILIYGCGNKNSDKVRGEDEVWIKNVSFIPDTLNIPIGTTVTWINQDSTEHTATSKDTINSENPV